MQHTQQRSAGDAKHSFPVITVLVIRRLDPRVTFWNLYYWSVLGDGTYLTRLSIGFN